MNKELVKIQNELNRAMYISDDEFEKKYMEFINNLLKIKTLVYKIYNLFRHRFVDRPGYIFPWSGRINFKKTYYRFNILDTVDNLEIDMLINLTSNLLWGIKRICIKKTHDIIEVLQSNFDLPIDINIRLTKKGNYNVYFYCLVWDENFTNCHYVSIKYLDQKNKLYLKYRNEIEFIAHYIFLRLCDTKLKFIIDTLKNDFKGFL